MQGWTMGDGTRRRGDFGDREAAAAYVAELTTDLATIARQHGLHTLGYILDMARMEAETLTRPDTNLQGH